MSRKEGWNRMQVVGLARVNDRMSDSLAGALAPAEYGFYFVIFYTVLGPPLGLILMGGIGSGFLLIPVLALCFVALGPSVLAVLQAAWIPIACGSSYLFIQLAVHEESMYGIYIYPFGPWLFSLVIVHALAMHRPNFLHRFAWFTFFIGLAMLPFMSLQYGGEYERIGLDRSAGVAYGNPNALAGWFGFCVLYLTIKGYVETRPAYRLAAWAIAVGSLYIVTLTVSRGALLAIVVSLLVASRRLLKAGFFPLLLLAGFLIGLIEMGVFDQAIRAYTLRGGEETGRLKLWPLLIERFLDSPLIGWGASNAGTVSSDGMFRTPHNSFLLFAVASGVVPFVLFCGYCFQSGMVALRANASDQDFLFYLPLVVYTVLITSAGNLDFMTPWAVLSLAVPLAAGDLKLTGAKRTVQRAYRLPAT
jgi:O-antigen ligase